ncbi:podoplanin isoform X1 [Synchiropus splendidus]|uniref:podoplanin isoform X1 n=1 Tax=Synchiropus splendidus TaxID=270530 RepID=UPI00237DBACC|nr:podoplanin isoform X1 [Synchiropus splendidus]
MRALLLLLLTLAVPIHTFPTSIPTDGPASHPKDEPPSDPTEGPVDGLPETTFPTVFLHPTSPHHLEVVTGTLPTEPATAEHVTGAATELVTDPAKTEARVMLTEAPTHSFMTTEQVTARAPTVEPITKLVQAEVLTEAATVPTATTEAESVAAETEADVTTEADTVAAESSEPTGAGTTDAVAIEDLDSEGLSTGQVVGIVIGALLAIAIVIAVVISVFRRMGKYTP